MKKIYRFASQNETEEFATRVAHILKAPRVLALYGDLGAGKTTFVRAFVHALPGGEKARVKSPSYALLHTYETHPKVHHLDLYRLSDRGHFEDLGLQEVLFDETSFVLIEWPQIIESALPQNSVRLTFKEVDSEAREVEFSAPDLNLDCF